ncbi:hypothetical protein DYB34_003684 [Aphanomyces astaci]|uniref:tRNA pseudouridine(55) synthase n=1 Tax=Aphanomyces astaci TaxID=112090 RepID=A0A397F345_APHAT|nr:hypothetical protein DYB34_003684 [Aphanomyces astaci]RHZ06526.1 hypothetical protein DYB31_003730 [Aphanomyces astaci]
MKKVKASGFINLHKPSGLTSHDCVAKLRRILRTKRVGHAGTLDPMATGVLPIAVNRATKFIQIQLEDVPLRNVTVDSITTLAFEPHPSFPEATIRVVCSEGTYIRSIARECGERIPMLSSSSHADTTSYVGATLSMLHRVQSGGFLSSSSVKLDEVAAAVNAGTFDLEPIESYLPTSFPTWTVDATTEARWIGGMSVHWFDDMASNASSLTNWPASDPSRLVAVYRHDGNQFLGVTTLTRTNELDRYVVTGPRVIVDPLE